MHIPDGYLSPWTCVAAYAAMAPAWYAASRSVERSAGAGGLALLALGAAFSFVIMMFNVPLPGATSGHMVGSTVVAIALGPWAAVIALSIALMLQALIFADGGVTTYGANAFNMALVMSFAGYWSYRLASIGSPGRLRRVVAAAAAGYVGVNAAALSAAFMLGLQPSIAHDAAGLPLYAPYPLGVTLPVVMLAHLVFIGPIEAAGTALVLSYADRAGLRFYGEGAGAAAGGRLRPLWIALAVLAAAAPLGLIAAGTPWGEWGADEIRAMTGRVPEGMERLGGLWRGLVPDYGAGLGDGFSGALFYVLSAATGAAAVVAVIYIWGRICRR